MGTITMWKQAKALNLEEILTLKEFVKLHPEHVIEEAFRKSIDAYLVGANRAETGNPTVELLFTKAEQLLAMVDKVNKCATQPDDCGNVNSDWIALAQRLQSI